jgi:hypothetical protein
LLRLCAPVLNSHGKLKVNRKARTYLDVAISADEGLSWNRIARLEDDFAPGVRSHYPTAVADETRIAVVYSKFFFGPQLDTALANNTAMGIRMKMVDVTRLPTIDHGDSSRITVGNPKASGPPGLRASGTTPHILSANITVRVRSPCYCYCSAPIKPPQHGRNTQLTDFKGAHASR